MKNVKEFEVAFNSFLEANNGSAVELHEAYRKMVAIISDQAFRDDCEFGYLFK